MPRAKRTARADARRRYRAAQNTPIDDLDEVDAEDSPSQGPAAATSRSTATTPDANRPRPSIATAFRQAFTPVDVRGDLRALPRLLINKAFWIPAGSIVVVAAVVIATSGRELTSQLIAPYFLYPPPIAPVFIAGFLAPRASWLIGGLVGVVQAIVLVVLTLPCVGLAPAAPEAGFLGYSLVISVGFGAFYAAAAAWYKRFLRGANPPRYAAGQAAKSGANQKRTGSSRPLLARRR